MEAILKPPSAFQFDNNLSSVTSGNLSKSWEDWKKSFNVYFEACELNKKDPNVQINILLHVIGAKCREVYDQKPSKCSTLKQALEIFDNFFLPKKNVTVERHKFFTRDQLNSESIEQYVYELNKMASNCELKDLSSELVKDRLICGIKDGGLRERLLREPDLTQAKALDICRLAELSKAQAGNIKNESANHQIHEVCQHHGESLEPEGDESVYWVQNTRCSCGAGARPGAPPRAAAPARGPQGARRRGRGRGRGRGRRPAAFATPQPAGTGWSAPGGQTAVPQTSSRLVNKVCEKCGTNHEYYKCPAYGVVCNNCNRHNHFAKMCKVYHVEGSSDQDSETA
ncbi:hypothetical protein JYU34_016606 [Plutella xylostella]|uniref:Retrotransposon gag domain-containing protein n=1 Tax=Plutella xylostella TaxID=51655 RepID=A0ABQ7Q314_PLUXY|nr:hypothetical protein JYU34_016606 [Plutella xylostella]